jgi:hypothetical protein
LDTLFNKQVFGECREDLNGAIVAEDRHALQIFDKRTNAAVTRSVASTRKTVCARRSSTKPDWYGCAYIYEVERAQDCYIYWTVGHLAQVLGVPMRWFSDRWETIADHLDNLGLDYLHIDRGWTGSPVKRTRGDEALAIHSLEDQLKPPTKIFSNVGVMVVHCGVHLGHSQRDDILKVRAAEKFRGFVNMYFHDRTFPLSLKYTARTLEGQTVVVMNTTVSAADAEAIVGSKRYNNEECGRVPLADVILALARDGCLRGKRGTRYSLRTVLP